jgi:hypothetical protein
LLSVLDDAAIGRTTGLSIEAIAQLRNNWPKPPITANCILV